MRYLMFVLGIIFLILLFNITVFSNGLKYNVSLTASEMLSQVNTSDLTFNRITNVLSENSGEDFFSAIKGVEKNFTDFGNAMKNLLGTGVNRLISCAVIFGAVFIISILIAYITTYCVGLTDRKEKNIVLTWLGTLLKSLVIVAILGVFIYMVINPQTQNAGMILLIVFPLLHCFLSILYEWITAGKARPSFTEVVTIKNILILLLTLIITIFFTAVVAVAVLYFFGVLIGVFLNLSLIILVFVTMSLNAHSIVAVNK